MVKKLYPIFKKNWIKNFRKLKIFFLWSVLWLSGRKKTWFWKKKLMPTYLKFFGRVVGIINLLVCSQDLRFSSLNRLVVQCFSFSENWVYTSWNVNLACWRNQNAWQWRALWPFNMILGWMICNNTNHNYYNWTGFKWYDFALLSTNKIIVKSLNE